MPAGVASRDASGRALALDDTVRDQPHRPRGHVRAQVPLRRARDGVRQAPLARAVARLVGRGAGGGRTRCCAPAASGRGRTDGSRCRWCAPRTRRRRRSGSRGWRRPGSAARSPWRPAWQRPDRCASQFMAVIGRRHHRRVGFDPPSRGAVVLTLGAHCATLRRREWPERCTPKVAFRKSLGSGSGVYAIVREVVAASTRLQSATSWRSTGSRPRPATASLTPLLLVDGEKVTADAKKLGKASVTAEVIAGTKSRRSGSSSSRTRPATRSARVTASGTGQGHRDRELRS